MWPDSAHRRKDQRSLDAAGGKRWIQDTRKEHGRQQAKEKHLLTKKKWRENTNQWSEKRIQGIFSGPVKRDKYGQPTGSFTVVSARNLPRCPGRQEGSGWQRQTVSHPSESKAGRVGKKSFKTMNDVGDFFRILFIGRRNFGNERIYRIWTPKDKGKEGESITTDQSKRGMDEEITPGSVLNLVNASGEAEGN